MPFSAESQRFNLNSNLSFWRANLQAGQDEVFYDFVASSLKGKLADKRSEHYIVHIEGIISNSPLAYVKNPPSSYFKSNYHFLIEPNIMKITPSSSQDKEADAFQEDCQKFSDDFCFAICIGGGGWDRHPAARIMIKNADYVFSLNNPGDLVEYINRLNRESA